MSVCQGCDGTWKSDPTDPETPQTAALDDIEGVTWWRTLGTARGRQIAPWEWETIEDAIRAVRDAEVRALVERLRDAYAERDSPVDVMAVSAFNAVLAILSDTPETGS